MRNKYLSIALLLSVFITIIFASIAYFMVGSTAAILLLICSFILIGIYSYYAKRRYRDIANLACQINDALVTKRDISFSNMREGDLSVLASEIDKTFQQLTVANKLVAKEKTQLADFLADISHQLRTPLTALSLELELMRKERPNAQLAARIQESEQLLQRVQWLVSALLKLARLDAGTVELISREVHVDNLIAAAFEPLALAYDYAQIDFECELQPDCTFEGDPAWTREALSNILKNSMEHTPAGGVVKVIASEDVLGTRISVQDSGNGIDPQDLPYIFERFYGSSENTEVNPRGVGVGLALAQALIVEQGGAIKASNIIDVDGTVTGAAFDIVFFKAIV